MNKDFIINITGGIGKHLMATSFIKWLSEVYPNRKISVISPFPEIFEYNPRIYRNLPINNAYLFEDYIKGKDYRDGDPYKRHEYYDEKQHLMKLFPLAYGFNQVNEKPESEVFLTQGEKEEMKMFEKQNGPIITMQISGGNPQNKFNPRKADQNQREIPMNIAKLMVNELILKGYKVIQIRNQTEPQIPGTLQINMPFRNILALASVIKGHIGIDSSMMHAVAVFKKPMLIFWGQTNYKNVGYSYDNVLNKYKKGCMQSRPACSLPDREGLFPFRDKSEALSWNWSNQEVVKYINNFNDIILQHGNK